MMGLSQEAIAKAVGITFQQVQKYEKGANAMNASRLYEFAQFMQVPVAYFFEGIEHSSSGSHSGFAEEGEKFSLPHRKVDRADAESAAVVLDYALESEDLVDHAISPTPPSPSAPCRTRSHS